MINVPRIPNHRLSFRSFLLSAYTMSHLCRLVPRSTATIFHASRMNAHSMPPGSSVKVPEAKSGQHIVSGSGQFIATDGTTPGRAGIGGGSSESMLPGAQIAHDKTNPTKTSADASQSQGRKGGPDAAYDAHLLYASLSPRIFSPRHQSIFKSPAGIAGVAAVAAVSICESPTKA